MSKCSSLLRFLIPNTQKDGSLNVTLLLAVRRHVFSCLSSSARDDGLLLRGPMHLILAAYESEFHWAPPGSQEKKVILTTSASVEWEIDI